MPDESDYGVEIPPRDHGPPAAVPTPDRAGRCTPVVPANWPFRDDVTPEEIDQVRQMVAAWRPPAGFTLYGLPVVVNPQVPSPRGIVFGPDIVPLDDADTPKGPPPVPGGGGVPVMANHDPGAVPANWPSRIVCQQADDVAGPWEDLESSPDGSTALNVTKRYVRKLVVVIKPDDVDTPHVVES